MALAHRPLARGFCAAHCRPCSWRRGPHLAGLRRRRHLLAGRDLSEPRTRAPAGVRSRPCVVGVQAWAHARGRCQVWWRHSFGSARPLAWTIHVSICSPSGLRCARSPMATAWSGYLLARRLGVESPLAASGAAVFALAGPAVYFGPKALSETVSALPIVLGLASALSPHATRRDRIAGAALLCVATIIRLHNAIFCLALLAVWLGERRWRALIDGVVVMAAGRAGAGRARQADLGRMVPISRAVPPLHLCDGWRASDRRLSGGLLPGDVRTLDAARRGSRRRAGDSGRRTRAEPGVGGCGVSAGARGHAQQGLPVCDCGYSTYGRAGRGRPAGDSRSQVRAARRWLPPRFLWPSAGGVW